MDQTKIVEAIAQIEKKLDAMQKDDTKADASVVKELEDKIAALQDEFRKAFQATAELQKKAPVVETLGTQFVKSAQFADWVAGRARKVSFSKAAASPVTSMEVKETRPGIIAAPVILTIEQHIPSVPTTSNLIEFVYEKAWEDNAAAVSEGASKPESKAEIGSASEPVVTVAHFIRITRQLAADNAALAAYIDLRMGKGVDKEAERQIIYGDKEDGELNGLMVDGNFTPHGFTKKENETDLDLIRKCATAIKVAGYMPSDVILNPVDYDTFLGMKTKDGAYLISNPTADTMPKLWGLNVIQSAAVAAGTFLVADLNMTMIHNREDLRIEMFEQDADNVTKNLITIRAERRMALTIEAKLALVGGEFWGTATGSGA